MLRVEFLIQVWPPSLVTSNYTRRVRSTRSHACGVPCASREGAVVFLLGVDVPCSNFGGASASRGCRSRLGSHLFVVRRFFLFIFLRVHFGVVSSFGNKRSDFVALTFQGHLLSLV